MLLILFPYKFTSFHNELLEMQILKKNLRKKILIHDISEIVNKGWNKDFKTKQHAKVTKFKDLSQWKKNFDKLQKNENLTIFSFLDLNSFKSLIVHYYLLKSKKKIIKIYTPGVYGYQKNNKVVIKTIITNLKKIIFQPLKSIFYIKKFLLGFLLKFFSYKKNIILFSGKLKLNPFKNKNDRYVHFHSFDYSRYLNKKKQNSKKINKDNLIFLDSAGPFFSDDLKMFGDKIFIDKRKWYQELNKFLRFLEIKFKSKIIIIPHSKNKGQKNPYYNSKFKIAHNNNAALDLIPNSKLVIANTATTAVSFAVASKRPILLIYNDQIHQKIKNRFFDLNNMSKILGTQLVNISNKFIDHEINLRVNTKKYMKYKYDYLTSRVIEKKMNYQIIDEITKL